MPSSTDRPSSLRLGFSAGTVVSLLVVMLFALAPAARAQAPFLLGDLVAGPGSSGGSSPGGWIVDGDRAFFQADHHFLGREYFVTDGTAGGTVLLADSSPGSASDHPEPYGVVDGRLFWWAWTTDARSGLGLLGALWTSDGTPEGTLRASPPEIGIPNPGVPRHAAAFAGDLLYFVGCSVDECALWASDGTATGTAAVHVFSGFPSFTEIDVVAAGDRVFYVVDEDLWSYAPGAGPTRLVAGDQVFRPPSNLAAVSSTLFFSLSPENHEEMLWKSDGTVAGTVPVSSLPGADDVWAGTRVSGSDLYFVAREDGSSGDLEIWKSDGTEGGTVQVTDFEGDVLDTRLFARDFLVVGERVFAATRSESSSQNDAVQVADGSPASTRDVTDCVGDCRVASQLVRLGDRVYFVLAFGERLQLWSSDGTEEGTGSVAEVCGEGCAGEVPVLHPLGGGELGFLTGGLVWVTDGTAAGTRTIIAAGQPPVRTFGDVAKLGDCYVFPGEDHRGEEPWCSAGTPAGARLVADIESAAAGSTPRDFFRVGDRTVFSALDEAGVRQVWVADGSPGGVRQISDRPFRSGLGLFGNGDFAIYTIPGDPTPLWRTDGTDAGTFPIGTLGRLMDVAYGDEIYSFAGSFAPSSLFGLYAIDGSPEGPRLVAEFENPLEGATVAGGLLYFVEQSEQTLWRTDGTTAGTLPLVSLPERTRFTQPLAITELNGQVYFVSYSLGDPDQIWRTDGTPGNTVPLATIPSFEEGFEDHRGLVAHDGALWFAARDDAPDAASLDLALYRWTEGGWVAVVRAGKHRGRTWLTPAGDRIYFVWDDGIHGSEPWVSDGTPGGTGMLADVHRGGPSNPSELTATPEGLYFAAGSDRWGRELFRTPAGGGVELVSDLFPGPFSSDPYALTLLDGVLYFEADDGVSGDEPWALRLDGSDPPEPPEFPPPPAGPWLTSPSVPGFRFKVRLSTPSGDRMGEREVDCIPETVCVSGALPGRSEVFLRVVGPKPNGKLWPTLVKFSTARVEIWVEQAATEQARYYDLAGASPGVDVLPGLFDRGGFDPAGEGLPASLLESAFYRALTPSVAGQPLTSPSLPSFTFRVEITSQQGQPIPVRVESDCIEETVCLSGAIPGRSELFLRVVGPKPNGKLWPTLVRFSTSTIDVWITQTSTGVERHYRLEGATPGSDDLSGLFDRTGFNP